MTGPEQVLVEDWCQQYPSHSIGALAFGADGALYVSGGDGASFNFADYGQDGSPLNPCGDPPGGVGATLTPPTAEGGALRSQDLRTGGDPTALDGTVLRIDPATGAPLPDNPLTAPADTNARRIVASRAAQPVPLHHPAGHQRDLGRRRRLEHLGGDRPASPARPPGATNFGWPCYEGAGRQGGYDGANLNLCENLYAPGGRRHRARTTPTTTAARWCRARPARPAARPSPGWPSADGRQLPGRLRRRAVLRRLLARLHLGDAQGHERPARPRAAGDLRGRARPTPST